MDEGFNFEYADAWRAAIEQVNDMQFPTDAGLFQRNSAVTAHFVGKTRHAVDYYRAVLPSVGDFPLEASYMICGECPERTVSQKFYLFNNKENTVYIRELVGKKY